MPEFCHQLLIRDRYQIVALSQQPGFEPGEVTGFAVLSPAGDRLRYELTLEGARLWVDKLIEEETLRRAETRPPAKVIRRSR
ncbi:MAG: hypothetical protein ABIO17_13735 [Pseudoxanthomonas sp.]